MRNPVLFLLGLLFMSSATMFAQQSLVDVAQQTPSQENQSIRVIHKVPPVYPAEAKAKGIGGTVTLEVVVNRQGHLSSARVIEGDEIFRQAALTAVKAWKFQPLTSAEQGITIIKMRFGPKSGS